MKILSPKQLQKADQKTIENKNISSWQLMEHASLQAVEELKKILPKNNKISILAGSGNNGGDGLAIAFHLNNLGYEVEIYLIEYAPDLSPDCSQNLKRLKENTEISIQHFDKNTKDVNLNFKPIIIDAIFGIGLNRALPDFVESIIENANKSKALRIAIDVPSGLFLSELTPQHSVVFQAHHTLTFQCPKLNFFLPDFGNYIGKISIVDIGLDQEFISTLNSKTEYVDDDVASALFKIRQRFSHKGNYGHLFIVGGQYGMMGSVCLTAKAAMKSGAGKVSVLSPKCGVEILQQYVPEAMVVPSDDQVNVMPIETQFEPSHICIGMGLGQSEQALKTLKYYIQKAKTPMLIDADGINILSENKELLKTLPAKSILTPHQGELKKLIGKWQDEYDKLDKMKSFVKTYNVVLVAKDAYTFIVDDGKIFINSTGNPGLATAGSGDTLSGIISSFLCQTYSPLEASVLGVFLHGKAADIYTHEFDENSLMASDITDNLKKGFSYLNFHKH